MTNKHNAEANTYQFLIEYNGREIESGKIIAQNYQEAEQIIKNKIEIIIN